MTPDDPRHGTYAGAVAHWIEKTDLCGPCTLAGRRYNKRRKVELYVTGQRRRVPTWRAHRRLQALQANGWSLTAIAERGGGTFSSLHNLMDSDNPEMYRSTFERVDAVYERLCMVLPKPSGYVTRTRKKAARRGWPPPLAWLDIDDPDEAPDRGHRDRLDHDQVDHAVVERVLGGDWRLRATRAEKEAVVGHWIAQGRPLVQLEALTGWKPERYYDVTREETA